MIRGYPDAMPQALFAGPLAAVHAAVESAVLGQGDDISRLVTSTQISYGASRKFAWLIPLSRAKALLNLDLWDERSAPWVRDVIRYRDDKFTHQIVLTSVGDVEAVVTAGWFHDAAQWGRMRH